MSVSSAPVIVWFRNDLRLADHRALTAAASSGMPVVACFLYDEQVEAIGSASRWWLHESLAAHTAALRRQGFGLVLRRGNAVATLASLVAETGAAAVHTIGCPEPDAARIERQIAAALERQGVTFRSHPGALLFDPNAIATLSGKPFRVFTPFWKACLSQPDPGAPLPAPTVLERFETDVRSDRLEHWNLRPRSPNWAGNFPSVWTPGEEGAHARLDEIVPRGLPGYLEHRDQPDRDATSRLSPHLHFGELSPRQVWHVVRAGCAAHPSAQRDGDGFLRQLGWREFSQHLLHHCPTLPTAPYRPEFERFPWREDQKVLVAWQRGQTGYPLVDAGMRELWATGWMHNRVRMVVASFLVKHLLIPWQSGAAWFWDTLVDADLANNSASWQWVAGSGADAAPYFRIFNPTLQSEKLDAEGRYVRRWIPPLRKLPAPFVHAPWTAPTAVLASSGIELGRDYPLPIVDHRAARERALTAYRALKSRS